MDDRMERRDILDRVRDDLELALQAVGVKLVNRKSGAAVQSDRYGFLAGKLHAASARWNDPSPRAEALEPRKIIPNISLTLQAPGTYRISLVDPEEYKASITVQSPHTILRTQFFCTNPKCSQIIIPTQAYEAQWESGKMFLRTCSKRCFDIVNGIPEK